MATRKTTITKQSTQREELFGTTAAVPVILVAFAPPGAVTVDRCLVAASFAVGRSSEADLPISDDKMSKRHFRITRTEDGHWVEDLASTNGTFVDGRPLSGRQPLHDGAIIRGGRSVFVFHADGEQLLDTTGGDSHGIVGRFHAGPLLRQLREAALSPRHILIAGPSGTGKELAARALSSMMARSRTPLALVTHNAAKFATEDEATTTIFGVNRGVFSNVDGRPGLIEQADGGALFLDEVHNLPERVQRSLLRVIENGETSRVGDTRPRPVRVRFILASNVEGSTHGLAYDLYQRLRIVRMPRLAERTADIPAIFDSVLRKALFRAGVSDTEVFPLLGGDHYETMCVDGHRRGNVRELIDLADRLATRISAGTDPAKAVAQVFLDRFCDGPVAKRLRGEDEQRETESASHYELHKTEIVRAIRECDGNLSAAERLLRSRNIRCSRRWLSIYANRWGLRR